jgi:hypothetical protein
MAVAYCAGYAAEVTSGYDKVTAARGAEDDFAEAERLIETWELPELEHWKRRAVELLSEPKNAAAVQLVADWLVTHRRIV